MATDWEANLRTLIKNTEKDADFLRRGSSWKVRGVRGKTQVTMRLQEGLGENNPRSSCMLDIEWKKGNNIAILNAIQDLKRLVNERNLSLTEAKIVIKNEREVRKASSELMKDFNKKIEVIENNHTQSSLYSSRHLSTQKEEEGAEAIVIKNEEKIREEMKKEKL